MQKLYDERKYNFDQKLKEVTGLLGAESYKGYDQERAAEILELYRLRGSAMHRAELLFQRKVPVSFEHAASFVYTVQDFLKWTKSQRQKLGLSSAGP